MKDNYWKTMSRKIIIILFIIMGISSNFNSSFSAEVGENFQDIFQKRPKEDEYCFDFVKVLPSDLVHEINIQGEGLNRTFDIDFVVVIIPTLEGRSITDFAVNLFSNWQIGKSTQGKKGILILIAMKEQQIKIEIGYDLEEVYTDLYVGQVEREMLKEFLEQADWKRGFLATIENFVERTYRMYKKGVDVTEITSQGGPDYYSGGAGARTVFDFGATLNKPLPTTSQALREYFGAQVSPELAFQRYMEFNARNMSDYTVDLFSDLSKEFFSHWRTSSGQHRAEAEANSGKPYIVKVKGRYAVVMAPPETAINDFICQCPYFFIHSEKGWQIDINTMSRSIIMGGPTWHFVSTLHPYIFAFDNYLIRMNRYYPLVGQKAFLGLTYGRWNKDYGGFEIVPELDSPAKEAGIQEGDILISIDGTAITEAYQDWEMMKRYNPGSVVTIGIVRNGKRIDLRAKLGEVTSYRDKFPYKKQEGDPWLGLYIGYSQPYERTIAEGYDSVLFVVENSPSQKAGLKPGDFFLYNQQNRDVLFTNKFKPGDKVKVKVLRDLKDVQELSIEIGNYTIGKEGI